MWEVVEREKAVKENTQVSGADNLVEDVTIFPEIEILEGKIGLGAREFVFIWNTFGLRNP